MARAPAKPAKAGAKAAPRGRGAKIKKPPPKPSAKAPAAPRRRAAKPPAKRVPAKRPARKAPAKAPVKKAASEPQVDLAALGAIVVGVSAKTVLIEMPVKTAADLFPAPLEESGPSRVVEGVERELKAIRQRDRALADSALAMSAFALAQEIDRPSNTASSKSACAKELRETLGQLGELVPEETKGELHDIRSGRAGRLAAGRPAS
jgi:hypothetical protein